jgi:thiamine monophosphate synthase
VAIGGIDETNLEEVLSHGARNVAVVRAVFGQRDTEEAARRLKEVLKKHEMSVLQVGK